MTAASRSATAAVTFGAAEERRPAAIAGGPGRTRPSGRWCGRCSGSTPSASSPHVKRPWPPRISPSQPGFASTARFSISASSNPGPLPGHPDDLAAVLLVELLQLRCAVGARRQRDRPVRMQVIDVIERQERVQRRVDRGRDAVLAERAQRVERRPSRPRAPRRGSARSDVRACPDRGSAKPEVPIERRSPPLPFTAITRCGSPVSGSGRSNFELVLPPPKLVMRRSAPSRFER